MPTGRREPNGPRRPTCAASRIAAFGREEGRDGLAFAAPAAHHPADRMERHLHMSGASHRHGLAVGDAVRLLVPIRTLPVAPGDVGRVSAVLGTTDTRALIAVRLEHSPLPVVLYDDEVEQLAPPALPRRRGKSARRRIRSRRLESRRQAGERRRSSLAGGACSLVAPCQAPRSNAPPRTRSPPT